MAFRIWNNRFQLFIFTVLNKSFCTICDFLGLYWKWKVWDAYLSFTKDLRIIGNAAAEVFVAPYNNIIMGAIASQITSITIVYLIVYSDADQRKHQSSTLLSFVRGIHRGPVNSPHKWPVSLKRFPFDDVIMYMLCCGGWMAPTHGHNETLGA